MATWQSAWGGLWLVTLPWHASDHGLAGQTDNHSTPRGQRSKLKGSVKQHRQHKSSDHLLYALKTKQLPKHLNVIKMPKAEKRQLLHHYTQHFCVSIFCVWIFHVFFNKYWHTREYREREHKGYRKLGRAVSNSKLVPQSGKWACFHIFEAENNFCFNFLIEANSLNSSFMTN